MEFEVFTRTGTTGFNFTSAQIVDVFSSLTVWRYYYSYDKFSVTVPLTVANIALFQNENLLMINDEYFYIDSVVSDDATSGKMTVTGKSLAGKSTKRIIARTYNVTKRAEQIVADHLNNELVAPTLAARKMNYLTLASVGTLTSGTVSYQNSYGTVSDEIESLMETYDFGLKEVATDYQTPSQQITLYKGTDKSDVVEFSAEYENILSESFEQSDYDEMTMAYVYGEGDGAARKSVKIGNSLSGIERSELYVDARDLQQTTQDDDGDDVTMSNADYLALLTERGNQKLAEQVAVLSMNGDIDLHSELFEYRTDYDVGDRVRVTSKIFGLTKTAVLTAVEETWDKDGHHLTPTWDKESPTLLTYIKRK